MSASRAAHPNPLPASGAGGPSGAGDGRRASLELGLIGNCTFNALVDRAANIVWCCMPRPDGDPVLHALLGQAAENGVTGRFGLELEDLAETRQRYIANTAILETELIDRAGNVARVTDFAPRFTDRGRTFRPLLLVRRIVPISGRPTFRLRLPYSRSKGRGGSITARGGPKSRAAAITCATSMRGRRCA